MRVGSGVENGQVVALKSKRTLIVIELAENYGRLTFLFCACASVFALISILKNTF